MPPVSIDATVPLTFFLDVVTFENVSKFVFFYCAIAAALVISIILYNHFS